ncbi:Uncharacterized protein dnm_099980 [Desulfonema magnum]|uniref:Uncharacterized protein n=1 Tax=Desulfonema magnum TaxID=45655 RepID=A0A975BYM4_9BACT|nr:Uncharacterized protein dnm_099980 [Desulfonema magnum]
MRNAETGKVIFLQTLSLFVVPLCLCVFVANFFGCVKDGTHPFL